jgi:outer membrane protein assembly factor BamB
MTTCDRLVSVTGRVVAGDVSPARGVPGVAVTDGLAVTRTDRDGRYRLLADPNRRSTMLVYITVPSGWRAPVSEVSTPVFFQQVRPSPGGAENVDFVLYRDIAADDAEYRFIGLTDVHVEDGAVNTRDGYRRQLEGINRLGRELEGIGPPRFAVVAGHNTKTATPDEFRDYRAATAAASVPVWSAPGNHDLGGYKRGGPNPKPSSSVPYRDVIDGYRQALGPEWYSFQYGPHHYVILENYRGLREPDQLSWLEQDLQLNAAGKRVVIVTHVPWNVPQTPEDDVVRPYLDLLADFDVRLLLAGHTHTNDVSPNVIGQATQVVTTSAVTTLDQTPRGFRMVEFRDGLRAPYYEYDADRRMTIVHPVGTVRRSPSSIQLSRYTPPDVPVQAEYRVSPGPWLPLQQRGSRAWTAAAEAATSPGSHELAVRVRDGANGSWTQETTTFEVADDPPARDPQQGTAWPMFHADAQHTGRTADVVAPPLDLAWVRHTSGTVLSSSPAVVGGTVYLGVRDEDSPAGNAVLALDLATGEQAWRFTADNAVEASVAVASGLVLAPSSRGPLYALDSRTGQVRWMWHPGRPGMAHCWMYFSPTVSGDLVYQAYNVANGTWIAGLDIETGQPRWGTKEPIGRNWISHASPAVAGDVVVFATAYANLVALDAQTGAVRWQQPLGAGLGVYAKPVVAGGMVFLACQGDQVAAVDLTSGEVRWRYRSDGATLLPGAATGATPAVCDGTLYAAFTDGRIVALDAGDGTEQWRHQADGAVVSSPAVSGDVLYVGSHDGRLRALDRHTGECVWAHDLGAWVVSSPAVTGNAVVVAAWNGNLHAFTAP